MKVLVFGGGDIAEGIQEGYINRKVINKSDCDVRDYQSVCKIIEKHRPSAIVYTAGVSHVGSIKDSDHLHWQEEIEVNLIGAYHVAKACSLFNVNTMIFIASVAGLYGKPNHSGYSASKAGIVSLVQSLAMEGYSAYSISPGRVDTKMREHDYPGEDNRTRLKISQVVQVVEDMLDGKYLPGDNRIIRKIGFRTYKKLDRGSGWKEYLKVGQPPRV